VPNIVPGAVKMVVELRDLSAKKIAAMSDQIRARAREIGVQTSTQIDMRQAAHHDAALATSEVQKSIEAACAKLGFNTSASQRGGTRRADDVAARADGDDLRAERRGHQPFAKELTGWLDCAHGAQVLMHTVLDWAGR